MSDAYIVDAVSEKVSNDICAVNPIHYDLKDIGVSDNANLDTLITDLMGPLFFQYCVNKGFIITTKSAMVQCIKIYVDYINNLMLDKLVPDYDPEEDLV